MVIHIYGYSPTHFIAGAKETSVSIELHDEDGHPIDSVGVLDLMIIQGGDDYDTLRSPLAILDKDILVLKQNEWKSVELVCDMCAYLTIFGIGGVMANRNCVFCKVHRRQYDECHSGEKRDLQNMVVGEGCLYEPLPKNVTIENIHLCQLHFQLRLSEALVKRYLNFFYGVHWGKEQENLEIRLKAFLKTCLGLNWEPKESGETVDNPDIEAIERKRELDSMANLLEMFAQVVTLLRPDEEIKDKKSTSVLIKLFQRELLNLFSGDQTPYMHCLRHLAEDIEEGKRLFTTQRSENFKRVNNLLVRL